jgi:hypothetical protein
VWAPDGPVERQIELLRQRTEELAVDVVNLGNDVRKVRTDLTDQVEANQRTHAADVEDLRNELASQRKRSDRVDATGFPVIAAGIVLAGLPDSAVEQPGVAWPLMAIAVVGALLATRRSVRVARLSKVSV